MPPITGAAHTLPFDRLSPRDFERLCMWLVEREGWERAENLGAARTRICPTTRIESPPVLGEWLACGGRLRDGGWGTASRILDK